MDFAPENVLTTIRIWMSILLWSATALAVLSVVAVAAAMVLWRSQRRNRLLLAAAAGLLLAVGAVSVQQFLLYRVWLPAYGAAGRNQAQLRGTLTSVGQPAPGFEVQTVDGETVMLSSLRGKFVLLNFFATWCGPCQVECQWLQKLWEKHRDKEGFALIAIGREETPEALAQFRTEHSLTYPMALDVDGTAYGAYAAEGVPRTYLIAADGTIVSQMTGFDDIFDDTLLRRLEELLEESLAGRGK